ncbi:MAG: matrixin family metalloprotease [bacterium]|nr:matrixin family metalloprotease [bacterium]
MLKFLASLLFLVVIFRASLGGVDSSILKDPSKLIYQYPCEAPLSYKLGTIDKKFNVAESKFLIDVQTAAGIWDKSYGQTLFKYDPENLAAVSVNLVYDERQSLNTQIGKLENVVGSSEQALKTQLAEYERRGKEFEKRLSAFNDQVKKWNQEGGAPPDEYEKLKKEQEDLEKEANYLNDTAKKLNISTSQHNSQVGQLNNSIENFNDVLKYKPEEGIFDPTQNKIDIYFGSNQKELVHTLAHELGHARGLDHNENEKAIMFPYTTEVLVPAKEDVDSLKAFCERRNVFLIFKDRINTLYQYLLQRYNFST